MNFVICTGRLAGELIAGDVQDLKPLIMILFIHALDVLVLGSETAAGRRIDDHNNLSFIFFQTEVAVLRRGYGIIINAHSVPS